MQMASILWTRLERSSDLDPESRFAATRSQYSDSHDLNRNVRNQYHNNDEEFCHQIMARSCDTKTWMLANHYTLEKML